MTNRQVLFLALAALCAPICVETGPTNTTVKSSSLDKGQVIYAESSEPFKDLFAEGEFEGIVNLSEEELVDVVSYRKVGRRRLGFVTKIQSLSESFSI